jgi:hypothetical protein
MKRRKLGRVDMIRLEKAEVGMMYTGKVDFPVIAYAAMLRGKVFIAMGGLAWYSGRCWLWVDHVDMKKTRALLMVSWAKRMLNKAQSLGETEVWARREPGVEPHSERLLKLLGFERVENDVVSDVEEWKCPV